MIKKNNPGYVYVIRAGNNYKIGVSKKPEERLKNLQTGNPEELILEYSEFKNEPYKVEKVVHRTLENQGQIRTKGEWFTGIEFKDIRTQLLLCIQYD